MNSRLFPVIALLLLATALSPGCASGRESDGGPASPALRTVRLTFEGAGSRALLVAEVADTPEARSRGLMFRDELPEDAGMLFVFEGPTGDGFWMKDTPLPLSIAFVDEDGTILDIQDMQPLSTELHFSPQRYVFAVEVNQGWFERNGIRPGGTVSGLPVPGTAQERNRARL